MTKKGLEALRNENRQKAVEMYHDTARYFEKFAGIVEAGGLLKDSDWGELNDVQFAEVPFEGGMKVSLCWLFSDGVNDEVENA